MDILIKFRHGLGDAVQLTSVVAQLRHYHPDWNVDVAALVGKHSAFHGLARNVFVPGASRWVPVQEVLHVSPEGGSATWLLPRESFSDAGGLALVFRLPGDPLGGERRFVAYGPPGRRVLARQELAGLKAEELVVGGLSRTGGRPGGFGEVD